MNDFFTTYHTLHDIIVFKRADKLVIEIDWDKKLLSIWGHELITVTEEEKKQILLQRKLTQRKLRKRLRDIVS